MATVTNTIRLPDGSTPSHAAAVIELVASTTSKAAGWVTSTDVTILSKVRPTVTAGAWTASLTPNADITPSGTVYKITETADRVQYVHYIEVGSGGGTVHDLLVDAPGTLPSAALSDHITDTSGAHAASAVSVLDTAGNFTGSNVETVLAELNDAAIPYEVPAPTSGAGTVASPWSHADGTGGINTAITAAASSKKPVMIRGGYYTISSPITGAFDGMQILTEGAATVFVVDSAISGGLAVQFEGTSGDYLENVRIAGFRIIRAGAGSVRLNYARRCHVGVISCTGAGGGVLSLRTIDRCQFDGVIGDSLGASGAAVFTNGTSHCQFGPIVADGGQETVDLFQTSYCQFSRIVSIAPTEEAVDMGCCQYNQFDEVVSIGAGGSGISIKVEDGATNGGSLHNKFGKVTIINHADKGVSFSNAPATPNGTDVNNYNIIENLTVTSTVSGSTGVKVASGTTNPRITGTQIRNLWIKTPGYAVEILASDDTIVAGGYAESTGAVGVLVDGSSDSTAIARAHIRGLKVVSAGAGSSSGAIQMVRTTNSSISDCEVLSSTGSGILLSRVKHCAVEQNFVHDCQYHGITFDVVDEASWRGAVHMSISRNRVRDIGKVGGTRWGLRINALGSTDTDVIRMDNNNVWDTQGTKTTRGVLWTHAAATFRYSSYVGNILKDLVDTRSGAPAGTGSVSTPNIEAA